MPRWAWRQKISADPAQYAEGVLTVLLAAGFTELEKEHLRQLLVQTVIAHATTPTQHLEVIIDSPVNANWRVKADDRPGRVRLACCAFDWTDADLKREQRINTELAVLRPSSVRPASASGRRAGRKNLA